MALHGLAHITVGVPNLDPTRAFYREFGLAETSPGRFDTAEGGEQLRLIERPSRRLVEYACAADDADDLARIRAAAESAGIEPHDDDGDLVLVEPIVGIRARVTIRPRIDQRPAEQVAYNGPGSSPRVSARAPGIFEEPVHPRRLGHALYTTPDFAASSRFLTEVLGFRLSDEVPGIIQFLRCSSDHHNIGLINAPVPFFHHSSWQVDDVDQIGHGAHHLLAVDPGRSVWGLGRHFLGSNFFWYFRDPAGNYAEYYADLDQIDDATWTAGSWEPDKSLYAWGPSVPADFVVPGDIEELSAVYATEQASA
jgi:catechol 2,3-dioxygenase-like lactoylglutathione lyase family enzyme